MTDAHNPPTLSPKGLLALQIGEMGELQSSIIEKDNTVTKEIQKLLLQLEKDVRPLLEELERKAKEADANASKHADEILEKGMKTAKFVTGVAQWRAGRDSLLVTDEASALSYLRRNGTLRMFSYVPDRKLLRTALTTNPQYAENVPGIEIISGASIAFTPTRTGVPINDTLKVTQDRLKQVSKTKKD